MVTKIKLIIKEVAIWVGMITGLLALCFIAYLAIVWAIFTFGFK